MSESELIEASRLLEEGRTVDLGYNFGRGDVEQHESKQLNRLYIIDIMRKWRNWQTHQT